MRPVTDENTWTTWLAWRGIEGNGFPNKTYLLSAAGGSRDSVKLTLKAPLWRVLGNKKEYYSDVGFSAQMSTNPGRLIDGFVYLLAPTDQNVSEARSVFCKIKITIYVKLFGRKLLTQTQWSTEDNESAQLHPETSVPPEYPAGDITVS